ncbi:MAG: phosphatase PAP2 family protein [Legionellaceae bacterium]|nr:phosphatase PAP2 family protein [Legionellaceae bacterium]
MFEAQTIDAIARFFLGFSHVGFILPMLALGFIFLDKPYFYHAYCIMFFSIIMNVALKSTFQVPLNPTIHHAGFAFPSGHMQLATIVYGWLAFNNANKHLRACICIILMGVGFGLVHFNYHTIIDVLGGVFFASLIILFYAFIKNKYQSKLPWLLYIIATLAMPYIAWQASIPTHAWEAFFALYICISIQVLYKHHAKKIKYTIQDLF